MPLPMRVSRDPSYDPLSLFRPERLLERFFAPQQWEWEREMAHFGVDIREDADHVYVEADLPGFKKDEIDLSIDNGVLTICAQKRHEPPEAKQSNVDQQKVNANLKEGCLTVTLDKTSESKARKIPLA
jgi:HSP20 family molecular chaperone IbpA